MKTSFKTAIISGSQSLIDFHNFTREGNYSEVVFLVDENTHKYCYPLLDLGEKYKVIEVKSGEENKTIETCLSVWDQLAAVAFDRKSLLVILGGGVLCDMGGFIASTFMRGVDFIFIPTTLLSMCDACIGGKTGVNFKGFKNQIGISENSKAVFVNTVFLNSLPEKHILSGYAEIIKHALIADEQLFCELIQSDNYRVNLDKLIFSI